MAAKLDPLSIVELIHGVPLGAASWEQVLKQVTLATGSRAATMLIQDRASGVLTGFHEYGIPTERGEVYERHYVYNDPRIEYAARHRNQRTVCDYDFITESQMDRHEYYAEFLAEGDFRYVAGVQLMELEAEGEFLSFTIQRSPREGHPTATEIKLLERLAPHVVQAARLERNLALHQIRESLFENLSGRLDTGILVCDIGGEVIWCNEAANAHIGAGKCLTVNRGSLHARTPALTRTLRMALAEACHALDGSLGAGRALRLPSTAGGEPTDALVCPFPGQAGFAARMLPRAGAYALVLLRSATRRRQPATTVLQQLYDLTPAEARAVALLAAGESTAGIAERMRVTRETLRSYLKQVFTKTGVSGQGELIGLVLNSPAVLVGESGAEPDLKPND